MRRILRKIAKLEKNQRADMLEKLAILTGLRPAEIPQLIKKELAEMPITIDLNENPLFVDYAKRMVERAVKEAEVHAEARGEARGEMLMLQHLLEKRFGSLPEWVNAHLEEASTEQLEAWSERIFDVNNVEEIFSLPPCWMILS